MLLAYLIFIRLWTFLDSFFRALVDFTLSILGSLLEKELYNSS